MSSITDTESRDEAYPPDLLHVSGLESNRTSSGSARRWNCPQCRVPIPAAEKEITKLRETKEYFETKYHHQYVGCTVTKHAVSDTKVT